MQPTINVDPTISGTVVTKPVTPILDCEMTLSQIGVQPSSPLAWSPDGTKLAYVNGTHGINLCVKDEHNIYVREKVLIGHHHVVKFILFHPTDAILVSAGVEGIFVWDLNTSQLLKKIDEDTVPDANEGEVECITWLYNGTILAAGGRDAAIKLYDVGKSFAYLESIMAHKSSVNTMVASEKGNFLVSAGRDSSINIYDTTTLSPENLPKRYATKGIVCTLVGSMDGHLGDVSTLATSSDGSLVFSGARDNTIRVWDVKSHKCIREVKDQNNLQSLHKGDVTNLFVLNDDQYLLSLSYDGTMHLYKLGEMAVDSKSEGDLTMISMEELLSGITETEAEHQVANDELVASVPIFPGDGVAFTALNPRFPLMATSSCDSSVKVWDIQANLTQPRLLQEFVSHSESVNALACTDTNLLVSVSNDYLVNVFDPKIGSRAFVVDTGASMFTVAAADDLLFAAGKDYVVHVYSLNRARYYQAMEQQFLLNGQRPPRAMYNLVTLTGHAGKVRSVAFSKPLGLVASAGEDGMVLLHSLPELGPVDVARTITPTEDAERTLTDHDGMVTGVAMSDDVDGSVYLASVGSDYALNLYNVSRSCKRVLCEKAHQGIVSVVAFGHGACAKLALTGSWDSTIKVWDVTVGECVKELRFHSERITGLCVSKDGKFLVSTAADKSVLLYDIEKDFLPVARYAADDECNCVCFVDNMVAVGYLSGVIRIWPLPSEDPSHFKEATITSL